MSNRDWLLLLHQQLSKCHMDDCLTTVWRGPYSFRSRCFPNLHHSHTHHHCHHRRLHHHLPCSRHHRSRDPPCSPEIAEVSSLCSILSDSSARLRRLVLLRCASLLPVSCIIHHITMTTDNITTHLLQQQTTNYTLFLTSQSTVTSNKKVEHWIQLIIFAEETNAVCSRFVI